MDNIQRYDPLKMYFSEDYYVTDKIMIREPSIQEIIDYPENDFWIMTKIICANTTSMRLELWNNGIDWNTISDFELFAMLIQGIPQEKTEIIIPGISFDSFRAIKNENNELILVYMKNPNIQIDINIYSQIIGYLRAMLDYYPKVEKAKGKFTKESIISEEMEELKFNLSKYKKSPWKTSRLFPLVSAACNHPGFKYKKTELKEVGIFEFLDSVKRLRIYDESTSLMTGVYMGTVNLKKVDIHKETDWARDLYGQ